MHAYDIAFILESLKKMGYLFVLITGQKLKPAKLT